MHNAWQGVFPGRVARVGLVRPEAVIPTVLIFSNRPIETKNGWPGLERFAKP